MGDAGLLQGAGVAGIILWIARQVMDLISKARSGELLKNGDDNRKSTQVLGDIKANTANLGIMAVQVAAIHSWVNPGTDPSWREKNLASDMKVIASIEATHVRIDRLADAMRVQRRGAEVND